jgi:ATP-binding cassette, subfamily G (WHITE), member 2, PDR
MLCVASEAVLTAFVLVNVVFPLTLLFCGVLGGPSGLSAFPRFWVRFAVAVVVCLKTHIPSQIFMYRVSPFTYLVDAMISVGVANAPATCSSIEVSHFDPPSGQTCGKYLSLFLKFFGGSLANPNATSDCQFCALTNTNAFLIRLFSNYQHRWRNFGILWVFIVVNIVGAVFFYWLARIPKVSHVKKNN